MAMLNPFDVLGGIDNDDPSQMINAAQQQLLKAAPKKALATQASAAQKQPSSLEKIQMPSKPLPPAQAVREAKNQMSTGRGSGRSGGGAGRVHGDGFNRQYGSRENAFNDGVSGWYGGVEDGESGKSLEKVQGSSAGPRSTYRGGRRGDFGNGEVGESDRNRRQFDRHSGTGRGSELKREGSGRGNWGTPSDDIVHEPAGFVNANEKISIPEVQAGEEDAADANNDNHMNGSKTQEKENEMTLDEYEKVLEEKRKALQALKTNERKVDLDKDFEFMQQLPAKKGDDVFIKLSYEKDKGKDAFEKEERTKKSVSINDFLKPAEGGSYHGRARGERGGLIGVFPGFNSYSTAVPSFEDPGHFPTLGAK